MNRFEGKVAFVSGAAHGIGRATALRLAAEGAAVAVADVELAAAEQVVAELGGQGIAVECDITSRASVDAAVAATVERFGRLDVLAQVAGHNLANREPVEAGDGQWARQYDFTFTGAVRCVEAALPHLVATGGAVVLVGSISGVVALGTNPYAAAKAALSSLVRNLAADHGPSGVRFNVVAPATVATRAFKDPRVLEELKAIYPLRRVGQPEDVAAAVAFLASADAAWITGITLPVEGGLTTGPGHLIG
ncbi:NAD(P)-dependent dehydrogenase (short-subunit alcohol dehydrogenase family) [Kribbella amoyensis]|uniref:NAD(P)-dependent dehydrogenase (Short-subunit alcohol dehydrogenase family) n=1 Tax=Kribbella amoyensis TaxID=996641 RepID=A0A561BLG4_9ACTN|nr:SDR family oxidoreductase [Kribbella amoyensis]TWD79632.1 NAD(P)-dependent dehydrogenase (short-subunit alcohol dehydrogenase family) [Kribbella amoyensis]